MGIDGDLPAKSLVEQHVPGHAGQPLVGAHDVRDLHEMVVHHVGQVVGGVAVGFQ